jgi:aminopeptidase N
MRGTGIAAAVAASAALTAGFTAAPVHAGGRYPPQAGSTQSGDSLFPSAGNGGYDASRYAIVLDYRPADNQLRATARMLARAPRPLSSFSLDLQGLTVRRVQVNGVQAAFRRHGHELVITPAHAVRARFGTTITYHGHPQRHIDPDNGSEGWIATADGATALDEPVGAMTWFPVNNTPRDKARYTFQVTAPSSVAVAANGLLAGRRTNAGGTTWTWRETSPMASYLAMVSIGDYRVFHSVMRTTTGRRLPVWSFVSWRLPSQSRARQLLPNVVRWGERRFGPYPFQSTGLVARPLYVGYALETQERPTFPGPVKTLELVHEIAHQWYGDSVTLRDWQDIWLNEGFATYAEWLWRGGHGGPSPEQIFRQAYRSNGPQAKLWQPAPARFSGPADLFGTPVYQRGAMTLQVLRDRVGSEAFFRTLRTWARVHRHGGAGTTEFTRLAERISGKNLDGLFQDWLYTPARPSGY